MSETKQEHKKWTFKYTPEKFNKFIYNIKNIIPQDKTFRVLKRYIVQQKAARILEAGCGSARHLIGAKLAFPDTDAYGVDYNAESIELAKALSQHFKMPATLKISDMQNMPFPDNFFDIVFNDSTMEHVKDIQPALLELHRVLKPNGILIVSVPNKLRFDGWPLYKLLYHPKYVFEPYYPWKFTKLLKKTRFTMVERIGSGYYLQRNFRKPKTEQMNYDARPIREGQLKRAIKIILDHFPPWLFLDVIYVAKK